MELDYSRILAQALTTLITIGILFVLIRFLLRRRPSEVVAKKPRKLKSFTVNHDKEKIIKLITSQVEAIGYALEDNSNVDADLLISDAMTATSWGFYYSIYLTTTEKHATLVEIGIKSKAFQMGPIVTKHHLNCVAKLKSILN